MATESEILIKLNDLLATYDAALSISGGSKLLTLARTNTGDTAAVVIKQGTGERWRLGQFGADAFALQRSPSGAAVDYTDVISVNRSTGTITMAGLLGIAAGNAGAPSLHVAGDTNTGLYSPGPDQFGIATGGVGRVLVSVSGLVGIGTTSPGVRLDVAGAVRASEGMRIEVSGGADATLNMLRTDTGARAWLGIPNWNPDAFYIYGPTANGSEPSAIYEAGTWRFMAAGVERMRITALGRIGIGTSGPNEWALLELSSTTQGFLPPRLSTAQRNAITTPPKGLTLYNTSTDKLQVFAGGVWVDLH